MYLGVSMFPGRRNASETGNGFVSSSHVVHFHWRSVPVLYNSFSNIVVHLERISARSFFLGSTFVLCLWPLLLFCFYLDVTQLIIFVKTIFVSSFVLDSYARCVNNKVVFDCTLL